MKYSITFIICLFFFQGFSQKKVSDYKYAIVPEKFDFQGEPNQFRLNQLTKFLLKKYGFEAYVESDELPEDLRENNCLALRAIVESSGTFKTRTKVKFVDCYNNLIFISDEAVTREKEYSKAYNLTIREAFNSVERLNYKYIPKEGAQENKEKPNTVKKEVKPKIESKKEDEIEEVEKKGAESITIAPEKSEDNPLDSFKKYTRNSEQFYLKSGLGGMYMVDKNNDTVFKLQDTSKDNVFIVTINNLIGVAFLNKEDRFYTLEYFKGKERKIEIYKAVQ